MTETHNIFLLLVIVKMTMTPIKKIKITCECSITNTFLRFEIKKGNLTANLLNLQTFNTATGSRN